MSQSLSNRDDALGSAPIGKLILKLALPSVIAQLVNMLYNIVDRMYIGHIPEIGASALTGLGVCFPIIVVISSFSAFVGMGGAPLAAIRMGEKDHKGAEKILGNSVTMLLFFSVVLFLGFFLFKNPLLYLFGASNDTIVFAESYLTIYLYGTLFVQFALGLNPFITCQGQARVAMLSVVIGAACNIVLDPIFIFALNMGVRGAALATILSQAVSAAWVVRFLLSDDTAIRIRTSNLRPDKAIILHSASLGISPFVMQVTEGAIVMVFNSGLKFYGGDLHVGAMTILSSVMQLIKVPIQGISSGIQPIISYNYGAKNFDRVESAVKKSVIIIMTATILCCLLTQLFPTFFGRIFNDDPDLIALVGKTLPIFTGGVWIFGFQMAFQSAFVGMGQAKVSVFLAVFRKIILLIPLALLLPRWLGVTGIYWSEPIADVISAVTCAILFLIRYPIIKRDRLAAPENPIS